MTDQFVKQRILVVDDEPGNIRILLELLRQDYTTLVATNGETALQIALSDHPPDLILLDVMMPEMDGYKVCKRLKADTRTQKIPVIFITAKDSEQDEMRGFELGAVDYIMKPFRPVIVKARVQTHAELKRYRDILEGLSFRDGLTGVANRRRFDEYLRTAWEFAVRESSPLSLILLDIDHFKKFNDLYGHQTGDSCLIQIAQQLAASFRRKIDLVARYGGDEFACILPKTNFDDAVMIAENIRANVLSLKIPHDSSPTGRYVSLSLGTATIIPPAKFTSPNDLVKSADEALYRSKKNGRNKVSAAGYGLGG